MLLVLSRMKRILEVDLENGRVCVEPGVTNANVSAAVGPAFSATLPPIEHTTWLDGSGG